MSELEYPAVLVLTRTDAKTGELVTIRDNRILHDDAELGQRVAMYYNLEAMGAHHYTYTPTPLNGNGAGTATNSPAPEAPTSEDPTQTQDTTEPARRQVALVVRYQTDHAGKLPRISGGELLAMKVDGLEAEPPTRNLEHLYRLLSKRGYEPDLRAFRWLAPVNWRGERERVQVYVKTA